MYLKRMVSLLFLTLVACGSEPVEQMPLKLAGVNYLGDLPTFIAAGQGIFEQYQLPIEVSFDDMGKQNLQDLRDGHIDFALLAPTVFILDRLAHDDGLQQDNDPVILANLLHATGMQQIYTRNDSGIQTLNDLAGKRLGVSPGTDAEYLWWLHSTTTRLETDAIEIVAIPPAELGSALLNDEVDAVLAREPWSTQLNLTLEDQLKQLGDNHFYSAKWLLVTSRKMVRDFPEQCQQLLAAYAKAINMIQQDHDAIMAWYSNELVSQYSFLPATYSAGLHELTLNWSLIAELQQGVQWAKVKGATGADNETNVVSWFETEPLRQLLPHAVKVPVMSTAGSK